MTFPTFLENNADHANLLIRYSVDLAGGHQQRRPTYAGEDS